MVGLVDLVYSSRTESSKCGMGQSSGNTLPAKEMSISWVLFKGGYHMQLISGISLPGVLSL